MYEIKKGCAQALAGAIAALSVYAIATPTPAQADNFTLNNSNNNSGTFDFTGFIDIINITTTGIYTIDAFGAQGGSSDGNLGGKGGNLRADFSLTAGQILSILVGQQGGNGSSDSLRLGSIFSNDAVRSGNGVLSITFNSTAVPEPLTIIGTIIGGTAAMRLRKKLKSAGEE